MVHKIIIIIMLLLIPAVSADSEETKIVITECNKSHQNDETLYVYGQLMYADGSEIKVSKGDVFSVYLLLNREYHTTEFFKTPYATRCNSDGSFRASCNVEAMSDHKLNLGYNDIQVVFKGKDIAYGKTVEYSHLPSESEVISVYAYNKYNPPSKVDMPGLVKFIGYAKGFFALVFFGVLGITIGTGCYSAAVHDPQKKAGAQEGLFSLLKVLGTVTCFYMAMLFLASA